MSKSSKIANKERNRKAKRSAKEAQQAKYNAWAAEGKNKKSARAKAKAKSGKVVMRSMRHANGACTNTGCSRCNPNSPLTNPWLAPVTSCLYSKRFTSSKWKHAA